MLVVDTTDRTGPGRWVGIPYRDHGRDYLKGCDCWGLVMLWQKAEMGRDLPDYSETYGSADDLGGVANAIKEHGVGPGWEQVELGDARKGDLVLLQFEGQPCHCGVILSRGLMLHTLKGHDSAIERYDSRLFSKRVQGVFRWTGN